MFGPRRVFQSQIRHLANHSKTPSRFRYNPTRNASTAAQAPTAQSSRWPRRLIYAGIFGSLGISAGKWMDRKIGEPAIPGTEADAMELEEINRVYNFGLPIVQELRNNPDYVESDVYQNYTDEEKAHRLTSGPLAGSRALALQKVFWNEKEKKAINVVFLGPGTEGWPTIVHGGALGTVIDENLGRVAIRCFPERTGVTANLQLNYRAPVYSDQFYVFYSTIDQEKSTDRKAYVSGEVRDVIGRVCVEASGLFVVPKKLKLQRVGDKY
ncbi:hypothetical protein ASPWEDRAFT_35784 [Aspergillus wentii DTO 134E9]|uniref:Thioesterase domain-containing protein n=1 Tax=Aspergillus wentii DTO 134E9 TaxID=1073089 RepID=A0A1L9RTD8_ASPWE|nr:uncharacterized protein ASPWEDRAFT_35784 [Aspergillus wentii DTO 134E9]KAI9933843.1 hypothetical protein MW887_004915 [Aspergillus wentii]OJJ38192.1 hypothetical protein ASPWEDRAFT_35784 [Aspergillus wentii DTO 134E9]